MVAGWQARLCQNDWHLVADSTAALSSVRYVLTGPLRWQALDGEWLVYSTATAALRHADAVDAAVLALLESGPAAADDMAEALAAATDLPLDAQHRAGLTELLRQLADIGFLQALAR